MRIISGDMIQRIQTVYLALAAFAAGVLSFMVSFWTGDDGAAIFLTDMFYARDLFMQSIPVLFLISALLSLLGIFMFKNRTKQIISNRINIVINFFLLVIIVYSLLNLPGESELSEKGIGLFIPIGIIVLLVLANKAIIRDEKLVKSVDRLR